jgi:hypothetical protein
MSRNESLSAALDRIQAYIAENADATGALNSHRVGVQFALFAIVSAIKLSPEFNMPMLRQFAQAALENPPPEFAGDAVFREPLALLLDVTTPEEKTGLCE